MMEVVVQKEEKRRNGRKVLVIAAAAIVPFAVVVVAVAVVVVTRIVVVVDVAVVDVEDGCFVATIADIAVVDKMGLKLTRWMVGEIESVEESNARLLQMHLLPRPQVIQKEACIRYGEMEAEQSGDCCWPRRVLLEVFPTKWGPWIKACLYSRSRREYRQNGYYD